MKNILRRIAIAFITILFLSAAIPATPLLDPNEQGFAGQSRSNNYDELMNSLFANGLAVAAIDDKMWVPWYKTSSSCQQSDLQSGANCNSGSTIDGTHNC